MRELGNVAEQAVVLAAGEAIEEDDLQLDGAPSGEAGAAPTPGASFGESKGQAVEAFERTYLLRALREHDGNISRTAEAIGMVRQSLQQKIRELGLRSEDWRSR